MHTNHSDIMEWNSYRFQNEIVTFFIMGIAGTVTASLGVIGNLISLSILFRRRRNWITTDIYLIGLTMSDLLLLIFFILIALKDTRKPNLKVAQWLMWQDVAMVPKVFPVCHALLLFFQVSSIWLTTFLSVERFFIICYPFKAERICSLKIASINTTLVVAASLVYNIPRFFEYILWSADWSQPVLSDYLNTTSIYNFTNTQFLKMQYTWYDISEFGKSPSFRIWYTLYSWIVLVFLGPIITIVITNSLLLIEIKRVNRRAKRNNFNVVDVNQDTNKMLIGVIFFFLLTQIPASISHVIWAYMAGDKFQQWYFIINEIGNYLVILNSAINIVSYLIFSKRFRKEFIKIIKEIMGPRRFVEEQRGTSRDVEFSNRYRNSSPWRRNLRLNDGEVKAIVEKNEI